MVNCKNCGVELDEHMNFCPVCGVPVLKEDNEKRSRLIREKQVGSRKLKSEIDLLNRKQKRKLVWEVSSIILASGIVAAMLLNFLIDNSFSWSLYVLTGAVTLFLYVTVYSFSKNEILILLEVLIISALSLIALDLINQSINWSYQLGIPLLLAGWFVLFLMNVALRHIREKGFNLIAYIFLASAILSMVVEGIISIYKNSFQLSWSLIVFFSTLPIAIILIYIHYKLRKGTDLRKFFHI